MKIWGVGQNRQVGLHATRFGQQLAVFPVYPRDVADHLDQSDHREAGGIHHGTDAGLAHVRTGATVEFGLRPAATEGFHQVGSVQIA